MTSNFQRKCSSEPSMSSRNIGNGYGHFLDIDANETQIYNFDRRVQDKVRIRITKTPDNSDDESHKDPDAGDPDKNNSRKKVLIVGLVYLVAISYIAIEYFMFSTKAKAN